MKISDLSLKIRSQAPSTEEIRPKDRKILGSIFYAIADNLIIFNYIYI